MIEESCNIIPFLAFENNERTWTYCCIRFYHFNGLDPSISSTNFTNMINDIYLMDFMKKYTQTRSFKNIYSYWYKLTWKYIENRWRWVCLNKRKDYVIWNHSWLFVLSILLYFKILMPDFKLVTIKKSY